MSYDKPARHVREYVTVVNDLERGVVTHVADGRGRAAIDGYFEDLGETNCAGIEQGETYEDALAVMERVYSEKRESEGEVGIRRAMQVVAWTFEEWLVRRETADAALSFCWDAYEELGRDLEAVQGAVPQRQRRTRRQEVRNDRSKRPAKSRTVA